MTFVTVVVVLDAPWLAEIAVAAPAPISADTTTTLPILTTLEVTPGLYARQIERRLS